VGKAHQPSTSKKTQITTIKNKRFKPYSTNNRSRRLTKRENNGPLTAGRKSSRKEEKDIRQWKDASPTYYQKIKDPRARKENRSDHRSHRADLKSVKLRKSGRVKRGGLSKVLEGGVPTS